jgi:hypothetical protein
VRATPRWLTHAYFEVGCTDIEEQRHSRRRRSSSSRRQKEHKPKRGAGLDLRQNIAATVVVPAHREVEHQREGRDRNPQSDADLRYEHLPQPNIDQHLSEGGDVGEKEEECIWKEFRSIVVQRNGEATRTVPGLDVVEFGSPSSYSRQGKKGEHGGESAQGHGDVRHESEGHHESRGEADILWVKTDRGGGEGRDFD